MTARRNTDRQRELTALRLGTVEAILSCHDLTPLARVLGAWVTMRYVNGEHLMATGDMLAWPSKARLVSDLGVTENTASAAIKQLVERAFFERVETTAVRGGRIWTHVYRVIPREPPAHETASKSNDFLGLRPGQAGVVVEFTHPAKFAGAHPAKNGSGSRKNRGLNTASPLETNPSQERGTA